MFFLGMIIGAAGWYLSHLAFGVNPSDSTIGFYAVQIFFCALSCLLSYANNSVYKLIKLMLGLYIGQIIYYFASAGFEGKDMAISQLSAIFGFCVPALIVGFLAIVARKIINKRRSKL